MKLKLIKTEPEYKVALERISEIFDAKPNTQDGDELELLVHLVEQYEEANYPIDYPDPIEAIKFRMEQQGLKQADMVPYIGSKSKVSEVLNRKRSLSLSMIRKLNKGLGIPAEVLLQEPGKALSPLYEGVDWNSFPLNEMLKRGWFPNFKGKAKDLAERGEEILGPFLFPNGTDCRQIAAAARQGGGKNANKDNYALWAWQARVLALSEERGNLGKYDAKAMTVNLMRSIITLSRLDDGPIQAQRLLEKNGVAVVILNYLPGTHLDGMTMMRADGHPVVALTLRHDRLDNFWFTLAHELAHVVLHLAKGDNTVFLDDLESHVRKNRKESEADKLASELLIPSKKWTASKITRSPHTENVKELATRVHVHPSIVAGRLRFLKKDYTILNPLVGNRQVRKQFPAFKVGC